MLRDDDEYEVGYGKPPRKMRFRKGESGNPKGRPKGKLNWATVLERALQEQVVINENGVRRTVTKLEAAYTQLVNKAASGDLTALKLLAALARSAEESAAQKVQPGSPSNDADRKVLGNLLRRLSSAKKED
jgi:Family of unknown function (DUF5681)